MAKGTREVAEARYARAQAKAREAAQVMSEVEAEEKRVAANTARLKALRMARDEKLAAEEAANPTKKKKPAKKAAAGKAAPKAKAKPAKAAKTAKSIPVEELDASNDK